MDAGRQGWMGPDVHGDTLDTEVWQRRINELSKVLRQLRRAVDQAEVALANLEEQHTTYFMEQSVWTGD